MTLSFGSSAQNLCCWYAQSCLVTIAHTCILTDPECVYLCHIGAPSSLPLLWLTVISIRHYNHRAFKCSLRGSLLLAASPLPLTGWKVSHPPSYSSGTVVGGHSQKWWGLSWYLLWCSPLISQTGVLWNKELVFSVTKEALFALYTCLWRTHNLVCSRVSCQLS